MNPKKILISGAGIAGPTLAYWLHRSGHEVTVIERAPKLRLGGQNIDVSDAAVDIVKMMEIEKLILEHNTTEVGLQIINEKGEVGAEFPKGAALTFTSKYEILRGDLGEILVGLTRDKVRYLFGTTVEKITEARDKVSVIFKSGETEDFDLLISADGVSSSTRALIVDDQSPYKYLGVYTSYATIPKRESDGRWARWYNATLGRVLLVRPDNKGTTRASVNYWYDGPMLPHLTNAEVIAKIRGILKGAGWEADRIAQDIDKDPDIYLGPVSQVRLKKWSSGRCVLVGDAAYCPTPFTGMGTTLAVIGAYILAGELAKDDDHARAFRDYEACLRPFVEDIQKVIPGQFRLVYPQSKTGVKIINRMFALFGNPTAQRLFGALKKKPTEAVRKFELPKYEFGN